MKSRLDFVSNSSSCSSIIAVNASYSIEQIAKDIAKNCINKNSRCHDPSLKKRNELTLNFCLNSYEKLFLGTWTLETHEKVLTKKEVLKIHGKKYYEDEWQSIVDDVAERKKLKIKAANGKYDFVDTKSNAVHWFIDDIAFDCVVTTENMLRDFDILRFVEFADEKHKAKAIEDGKKDVYENLKKYAKTLVKNEIDGDWFMLESPEIYQITKRTIANTRLLLEKGENIKFDKWEYLDALENRLSNRQKIFGIKIAHSGDGYGTYYIYEEEGQEGHAFDNIAAEIISGECS